MTGACASCHTTAASAHRSSTIATRRPSTTPTRRAARRSLDRLPRGSTCAGCHSSNFSPDEGHTDTRAQRHGVRCRERHADRHSIWCAGRHSASSEEFIGCSSCHYGASAGISPLDGPDANDTAHRSPYGEMANADICGACHSRYSYTTDTFTVQPIPSETPPVLLQPQMAIGYPMLGMPGATGWDPASPLSDYLNIPVTGWTPTPVRRPAASGLMTYWKDAEGIDMLWQQGWTRRQRRSVSRVAERGSRHGARRAEGSHGPEPARRVSRVPFRRLPHRRGGGQDPADRRSDQVRHHLCGLPHAARRRHHQGRVGRGVRRTAHRQSRRTAATCASPATTANCLSAPRRLPAPRSIIR